MASCIMCDSNIQYHNCCFALHLRRACRLINQRYFRGSPTFYVDTGMNIHLGLNTLNQFQSYSQPYPVETPIIRPYEDKQTTANPAYSPAYSPVLVTAQVLPQVQQPEPRHAQVSDSASDSVICPCRHIYMCRIRSYTIWSFGHTVTVH